ncbi:uncharacterized protein MICPUCDRAFT_53335 [Micromonas pusilla CCMP1545]|uniref:Predicted protein n=1 Tax=Micromonas pusilla (strain CCMP1545) TaxID=564608 RepID=C1N6J2_MICPC|nr:uncharacterized protein MICPUCDRAFT_53335 [Micromonas pusilla CCMP1545]EEH51927.1 predicted protein [Micromonas pusilla CCMP1545]|eukprot:XP_003063554.1 predicted protein [Micromonas pusilla CCMP1545]
MTAGLAASVTQRETRTAIAMQVAEAETRGGEPSARRPRKGHAPRATTKTAPSATDVEIDVLAPATDEKEVSDTPSRGPADGVAGPPRGYRDLADVDDPAKNENADAREDDREDDAAADDDDDARETTETMGQTVTTAVPAAAARPPVNVEDDDAEDDDDATARSEEDVERNAVAASPTYAARGPSGATATGTATMTREELVGGLGGGDDGGKPNTPGSVHKPVGRPMNVVSSPSATVNADGSLRSERLAAARTLLAAPAPPGGVGVAATADRSTEDAAADAEARWRALTAAAEAPPLYHITPAADELANAGGGGGGGGGLKYGEMGSRSKASAQGWVHRVRVKKKCVVDDCARFRVAPEGVGSRHNGKIRLPLTCPMHLDATTVLIGGIPSRECQACRAFHPLSEFGKDNKTCERRLKRKKVRYHMSATGSDFTDAEAEAAALALVEKAGDRRVPVFSAASLKRGGGSGGGGGFRLLGGHPKKKRTGVTPGPVREKIRSEAKQIAAGLPGSFPAPPRSTADDDDADAGLLERYSSLRGSMPRDASLHEAAARGAARGFHDAVTNAVTNAVTSANDAGYAHQPALAELGRRQQPPPSAPPPPRASSPNPGQSPAQQAAATLAAQCLMAASTLLSQVASSPAAAAAAPPPPAPATQSSPAGALIAALHQQRQSAAGAGANLAALLAAGGLPGAGGAGGDGGGVGGLSADALEAMRAAQARADAANEAADRANGDVQKQLSDAQVRSTQKFFTHRPVSTFDRFPFQLTGELFLYGMALRRRRGAG